MQLYSKHVARSSSDNGWVEDKLVDATNATNSTSGDAYVAILAPVGSPGVANNVVLDAVLLTPADGKGCVIDILATVRVVCEDTAAVAAESIISGSNGHIQWLPVKLSKILLGADCAIVRNNLSDTLALVILALALLASVRIVARVHNFVLFEVLVGVELRAASTAEIDFRAVKQLLGGEIDGTVTGDHPCRLDSLDCRESPAGTTVALVLHRTRLS